jgi:hypothetical protein
MPQQQRVLPREDETSFVRQRPPHGRTPFCGRRPRRFQLWIAAAFLTISAQSRDGEDLAAVPPRMLTRGTMEGSKYYWAGLIGQGRVVHFVEVFDVPPSPQVPTCPAERMSGIAPARVCSMASAP